MTATDELRRLLDERGVKWDYGITGAATTRFNTNGIDLTFTPMRDGLVCSTVLTPVQAIAATLGATDARPTQEESSGTCHITDNGPWGYPYVCSACGASFDPEVYDGEFNYCPNCGRRIEEVDE